MIADKVITADQFRLGIRAGDSSDRFIFNSEVMKNSFQEQETIQRIASLDKQLK